MFILINLHGVKIMRKLFFFLCFLILCFSYLSAFPYRYRTESGVKGYAIPPVYGEVSDFSNGFAVASYTKPTIFFLNTHEKINIFVRKKMYKFIIDKRGRKINNEKYYTVSEFSKDGYASVRDIALKGYNKSAIIDRRGRIVYPWKYPFYKKFYKGTAPVLFKPSSWGFIRRYGKRFRILSGPRYIGVLEFSEGLIAVQTYNPRYETTYGYADIYGKLVIPDKFSDADNFSEGLAYVKIKGEKYYSYINKQGRVVIRTRFKDVKRFRNGMAVFQGKSHRGSAQFGYINRSGNVVVRAKYDLAFDFSEGLGRVYVHKNRRFYYIDKSGRIVVNTNGYESAGAFVNGLAPVKNNNGKVGFIDKRGHWVIPAQFEKAKPFSDGIAAVKIKGKWGFIKLP